MPINFDSADDRTSYLAEKLDDLLEGINDSYGTVLLDELISRLERTISEFNDEMKELMDQLKANTEKKEKLLEKIKSGEFDKPIDEHQEEASSSTQVVSEWEKKLEAMEK